MQQHVTNGIGHFDIGGPDPEALHGFYRSVFGWTIDPKGPGYALVETPAGSANGAILETEAASITVGIVVADIDRVIESAIDQGGTIAMLATDNGWVKKAVLADPAGNRVTVIQA